MVASRFVINVDHRLLVTQPHGLVDVHDQLGESTRKIVDKLIRQCAQRLLHTLRQFAVVVLFISDRSQQIPHRDPVVGAKFFQI